MRRRARLALSLLLAVPCVAADLSALSGRWVRVPERSQSIPAAIESGIASLSFVARPIARARLSKIARTDTVLRIVPSPGEVSVSYDGFRCASPLDGRQVELWREGEAGRLASRTAGAVLVQEFHGKDGMQTNRIFLGSAERELVVETRLTSPRLKGPVTYRSVYRRDP